MLTPFLNRTLQVKIESPEGTDAVPTAPLNTIQCMDLSVMVEADNQDRNLDRSVFGGRPTALVRKRGIASGIIELVGHGTVGTAPPIAPLLLACGHAETLVAITSARYRPRSTGIPSATVKAFHSTEVFKFLGSRGMLSNLQFNIDDFPKAQFEIRGNPQTMAEAAMPTDSDVSAFQIPPVIVHDNSVMTIDGFNVDGKGLEIRPNVAMDIIHHTEGRVARHTDRVTEVTLRFFRSAYSDKNIHALANAETPVPIEFEITTSAGKNILVELPKVQLLLPKPVDIDGHFAWEVIGRVLPDAGDDEYSITFT
jgi:hypothetical protein